MHHLCSKLCYRNCQAQIIYCIAPSRVIVWCAAGQGSRIQEIYLGRIKKSFYTKQDKTKKHTNEYNSITFMTRVKTVKSVHFKKD